MNKSQNRIQSTIKARRAIGLKGESWDNQAIARDILFDELGYNQADRPNYHLDEQTKDILLAHARQDSSHALSNTISLLERVERLDRTVRSLCVFVVAAGITIVYLLWRIIQNSQV